MTGIEIVTLFYCLALGVGVLAIAWQVSRLGSELARTRNEDKHVRDVQMRHLMTGLAEVASTVKKIHVIASALIYRDGNERALTGLGMRAERGPEETPPTVRPRRQDDAGPAHADGVDAQRARPSDSDEETQCWTGPSSSKTMLGVGAAALTGQGPVYAPEVARQPESAKR